MAAYLDAWFEEAPDDATGIARALGDIARAKGMTQAAVEPDTGTPPARTLGETLNVGPARVKLRP